MRTSKWLILLLLPLLVGSARMALAQADSGRISGTVRDQSNAFVADATITVKNERTGETRSVTSNQAGFFAVTALRPSTYTVTVEKQGFAPIEYTEMPVTVGQELALDFEFRPAGVSESVTVVGEAPVLQLSAQVGASVTEREVQALPVNGRQMSQLMLQAPGSQNAGTGTWGDIRFSGRAVEQNVIKYDGVEASGVIDSAPGVANGENASLFKLQASLENVQEFRVESSNYPAEFGTGTGGQVSVITKSGSNLFRGSVFEYVRNDRFDAANYFDSQRALDGSITAEAGSAPTVPKSPLKLNQFGGSIGGPIMRDRAFFFGSYEGYRLNAGVNKIAGVPSAAGWAKAVPAIAALRPAFLAADAQLLAGASSDADVDIYQWQGTQEVAENAFSARLDFKFSDNWSSYFRVFHDQAESFNPEDVSGRRFHMMINPTNAIYNLQGLLGGGMINEFKFGYNAAPSTEDAEGFDPLLTNISLNLTGSVANAGIAGQGATSGTASPGGLVRVNSAGNGRGAPYDPYSLTFADSLSRVSGNHLFKVGADVRVIRMSTDQQGGITYTFTNISNFLQGTPSNVQFLDDLSAPSVFHDGAAGRKRIRQQYYVGFAQDEWRVSPTLTLNYGMRYDYYVPLTEADNRIAKFNIDTGQLDPDTTPLYKSKKTNFQPRVSAAFTPTPRTVVKAGFGMFVGPGQTEDQVQPVETERVISNFTSGPFLTFPDDTEALRQFFIANPDTRAYQPRSYANEYTLPEKVYQYTASIQRDLGDRLSASAAYVGSQGRNLFLRGIGNRLIGVQSRGATAAFQVREFDIVSCADGTTGTGTLCPGSTITGVQKPFAEVDIKTSGGRDSYNAMQLAISRRSANGIALNGQYTLAYSKGTSAGSNEAVTGGNSARFLPDWEYDDGYNNFDVRHTFNLSLVYTTPGNNPWTGGWTIGGIANARSGLPIEVLVTRADIVYVDGSGNYFLNPAADRTAVINTPNGGATRSKRRPDLVPGVDPYVKDGGRVLLNPAAFATPLPGTYGNLERNSIHGPNFWQVDTVFAKRIGRSQGPSGELRLEIFNIFNHTNFGTVGGTLNNALPTNATTEPNKVQPGVPFTSATGGAAFGVAASTVGTTVGTGTNRQIQLAFRFNF